MKNLKDLISLAWWLIACLLCFSATEGNAQVIKMSAKDLTKNSTAVLYGKCSKVKSEWNDKKNMILTSVTIVPDEYIKGNLGSEAVITVPGGRVDNILYEVSDMPLFIEGEDVVAFVSTNSKGKKGKKQNGSDELSFYQGFKVNPEKLKSITFDYTF